MLKNGKAASDSMISPFLEGFQVAESVEIVYVRPKL